MRGTGGQYCRLIKEGRFFDSRHDARAVLSGHQTGHGMTSVKEISEDVFC